MKLENTDEMTSLPEGTWIGEAVCCRNWPILQPVIAMPLRKCGYCGQVPRVIN